MSSLLYLLTILASAPFAVALPYLGALLWMWVSISNLHQAIYGPADGLSYGMIAALLAILPLVISREPKRFPITPTTIFIIGFSVMLCISQLLSVMPEFTFSYFDLQIKVLLMVGLLILMVNTRVRLHVAIWTYVLAMTYWIMKCGIFVVVTGGGARVFGPPNSMITDNNHLGLAMVLTVPLLIYLARTAPTKLIRTGLWVATVLTVLATVGTYSRGAFLSLAVMAVIFVALSRYWLRGLIVLLVAGVAIFAFMPREYHERLGTIRSAAQTDESFRDRLELWRNAWIAGLSRPLTGVGPRAIYHPTTLQRIAPERPYAGRAIHSAYFEIHASMGLTGVVLYLGCMGFTALSCLQLLRQTRGRADLLWANHLAKSLFAALCGFAVGAAALSMEFWSGYWVLVSFAVGLQQVVARRVAAGPEGAAETTGGPASPWMVAPGTQPAGALPWTR